MTSRTSARAYGSDQLSFDDVKTHSRFDKGRGRRPSLRMWRMRS